MCTCMPALLDGACKEGGLCVDANMYHMTMPLFVHVFGYVCIHKSVYIYVYIVCVCVCVRACVHRTSIGGGL